MPLPSAPEVTIHPPSAVLVGHDLDVGIEVTAKQPTKVEGITVRLFGKEGWSIGSGKHRINQRLTFPDLIATLMGEGTLPAGTTQFQARVPLPINLPPSHKMSPAYAELWLKVHVSIPWWPDGRSWFELKARLAPGPPLARSPIAARSEVRASDAPRIELGLASMNLIAGEAMVGACAVFHLDDREPRDVTLSLIPQLVLQRGTRTRQRAGDALTATLVIPAGGGGVDVPFRIPLPATMTPTFQATTHSLSWTLEARTGSLFGGRAETSLPIVIVDAATAAGEPMMAAAPALGDRRVHEMFATFARSAGWRVEPIAPGTVTGTGTGKSGADDHPPVHAAPAVVRDDGELELGISYVYRGTAGAFLVARVGSPPLGLGLRITPGGAMRHLFFRDVEVGITAWDRDHLVASRSTPQAVAFLTPLVPALLDERALTFVRGDDDGVVLERPALTVEYDDLVAIGDSLRRIAAAFTLALAAIPPPPEVDVDLAAWRELARWLDGRLALGDLGITGTLEGRSVEVELAWDEADVTAVLVRVGDPVQGVRGTVLSLEHPSDQALALPSLAADLTGAVADRLTEQLAGWPADIVHLAVAAGTASARLPLPTDVARPRLDTARVRSLIEALRSVLVTLEPGASPYR